MNQHRIRSAIAPVTGYLEMRHLVGAGSSEPVMSLHGITVATIRSLGDTPKHPRSALLTDLGCRAL
jgi:hypothetical protein